MRAWIGSCVAALTAALALSAPASAGTGSVSVSWYTTAVIKLTLTPNYATGFGTVKAVFGTQPTPAPGPGSCLDGCAVDFGPIEAGDSYLYKYAAHLNVTSNDGNGFNLYGEGAANFSDGGSNTMNLNQSLFWVPSVASGDTNNGYTGGYAFNVTSGTVNPAQPEPNIPPSIVYGTYPAAIETSGTPNADIYQDYELKVPMMAATGTTGTVDYYCWIVYTVVPK